ncbi:MAG: ferric reductase-like transmembrane domain-containing protein [Verrucomicrobia bacterium]|nr:ferric reductase-like transmembrane domain-containing protein [Verrucomicrobiota bacterium]MCH8510308.1 ferric reductase-like transmembrane domain-containing protein [Kiritimatiellia bacterium]
MKYSYLQAFGWLLLYVVMILSPLLLVVAGPLQAGRGFWIEFGVALGFIGLAMMCAQFLITGRFRVLAQGFGSDNLLHFHTATGVAGMLLVLAHPAILLWANPEFREYLDPSVNLPRVLALVPATIFTVLIVVFSLWRIPFRLMYEWWRVSHGFMSMFVVFVGTVHVMQVGHHTHLWWQKGYVVLFTCVALGAILHVRVIRPFRMKKRAWEIVEVRPERGGATTLVLEAKGHEGMAIEAGQYAWVTVGGSPHGLQQHPFSFSSGEADRKRVSFTAKPAGDFTRTWSEMKVGTPVYMDGPYGAFTPEKKSDRGMILFAGGVGVTPIMSILRTLAERGDSRECILFYGNRTFEDVIFREELEELEKVLNLRVIHVLSDAGEDWEGNKGYLDHAMMEKELPKDLLAYDYYICGPEPMMNLVESELASTKIPLPRIKSERFQIV